MPGSHSFSQLRLHAWLPSSFQKDLPALALTTLRVAFELPSPTKTLHFLAASRAEQKGPVSRLAAVLSGQQPTWGWMGPHGR